MSERPDKIWFAAIVSIDKAAIDAAEHALNMLDPLGIETDLLRKGGDSHATVSAYFDEAPDAAHLCEQIIDALEIYGVDAETEFSVSIAEVEDADWLAEWKRHWQPTVIGNFIISPPWFAIDDDEKHIIRIDPSMAFGTGTHDTTQLCLAALEQEVKTADSFFDVGTGTGILAIAAAMLGASPVVGCDNDLDSVVIARENIMLNGVADRVELYDGSITAETSDFDIVCANLTLDVIEPLLDQLVAKAKRTLILSGILAEQESSIRDSLSKLGHNEPKITYSGEWIAVKVSFGQA
ncbi:MAG: 50S ribosomal protein L11 methyltransferase [Blastocatellia bacterium]|nr:50S ribosomal protein L11 methyltransferase [Blastocatellia bacterium]